MITQLETVKEERNVVETGPTPLVYNEQTMYYLQKGQTDPRELIIREKSTGKIFEVRIKHKIVYLILLQGRKAWFMLDLHRRSKGEGYSVPYDLHERFDIFTQIDFNAGDKIMKKRPVPR